MPVFLGFLVILALCFAAGAFLPLHSNRAMVGTVAVLALLIPLGFVLLAYVLASTSPPQVPSDPNDAGGFLLTGSLLMFPVVYLVGLLPTGLAFLFGRRYHPDNAGTDGVHPLKLDRS